MDKALLTVFLLLISGTYGYSIRVTCQNNCCFCDPVFQVMCLSTTTVPPPGKTVLNADKRVRQKEVVTLQEAHAPQRLKRQRKSLQSGWRHRRPRQQHRRLHHNLVRYECISTMIKAKTNLGERIQQTRDPPKTRNVLVGHIAIYTYRAYISGCGTLNVHETICTACMNSFRKVSVTPYKHSNNLKLNRSKTSASRLQNKQWLQRYLEWLN